MNRKYVRVLSVVLALLCVCPCFLNAFAAQGTLYSVEFYWDKAGEDADNGYKAYSIEYGEKLKKPVDPQREDKVFIGWYDWYTEQPVEVENETMNNTNGRKFYAVWAEKTYKATFFVDGKIHAEITNVYGEAFISPRLPEKDGYTFKGWSPELPKTTPACDMEFKAVFEPNKYVATFIVDGQIYKQVGYTYGQKSVSLPEIPQKTGYDAQWESYSLGIGGVEINAVYTPKGKINSVKVESIKVNYKSSAKLNAVVEAEGEAQCSVYFFASNSAVAEVDKYGNVQAKSRGTTSVVCFANDQYGNQVSCISEVTVKFAWWQWLIYIFLFGFLWY